MTTTIMAPTTQQKQPKEVRFCKRLDVVFFVVQDDLCSTWKPTPRRRGKEASKPTSRAKQTKGWTVAQAPAVQAS
jgi:hypothetical protein